MNNVLCAVCTVVCVRVRVRTCVYVSHVCQTRACAHPPDSLKLKMMEQANSYVQYISLERNYQLQKRKIIFTGSILTICVTRPLFIGMIHEHVKTRDQHKSLII